MCRDPASHFDCEVDRIRSGTRYKRSRSWSMEEQGQQIDVAQILKALLDDHERRDAELAEERRLREEELAEEQRQREEERRARKAEMREERRLQRR